MASEKGIHWGLAARLVATGTIKVRVDAVSVPDFGQTAPLRDRTQARSPLST
jgi:hypothetical protein